MKWTIFLIAGIVLFVLACGYFWCFRQTVCVINSRLEIAGHRYVVNRGEISKFIKLIQPDKNIKRVYLYQKDEDVGLYKKVKSDNRPLKLERMPGRNGIQILEIQGKEPGLTVVTSLPT